MVSQMFSIFGPADCVGRGVTATLGLEVGGTSVGACVAGVVHATSNVRIVPTQNTVLDTNEPFIVSFLFEKI